MVAAPEIAFPTVVRADEMPVRLGWSYTPWFSPWPMQGWPLVWDFDEPETFTPWRERVQ